MPSSRIFRSRWAALLWAAGIVWTAIEVAGTAPSSNASATRHQTAPAATDATGAAVDNEDLGVLANAMGG